jgi:photosystem II stability/assembly factor-like uncharacterized protein
MNAQCLFILRFIYVLSLTATLTIAQWVPTNGPRGGEILTLMTYDTSLFAAAYPNVLYRSTDNSDSWNKIALNASSWVKSFAINGNTIFAGLDNGTFFTSVDGGTHWMEADSGLPGSTLSALAVNDSFIFAGFQNRACVYRSPVGTIMWTEAYNGLNSHLDNVVNTLSTCGDLLFAGTQDGVYMSVDNGKTWHRAPSGMNNCYVFSVLTIGGKILATTDKLYVSVDSGKTWTRVNSGLPDYLYSPKLFPIETTVYALSDSGIYSSPDSGSTWNRMEGGLMPCYQIITDKSGSLLFGANDKGVFRSNDKGLHWSECSMGISNVQISSLYSAGDRIIAGTNNGLLFSSIDRGQNWDKIDGMAGQIVSLWNLGQTLYAGCTGMGLLQSTDNGLHWTLGPLGLRNLPNHNIGAVYKVVESGGQLVAATQQGIFRSISMDSVWEKVNSSSGFFSIATYGKTIIAGSYLSGVHRSVNNGTTWVRIDSELLTSKLWSLALIGRTLILVSRGETTVDSIYQMDIEGNKWTYVSSFENPEKLPIAFCAHGSALYALTTRGVFRSDDKGSHWMDLSTGLTDSNAKALLFAGDDCYLGTAYNGVWRRPAGELMPNTNVWATAAGKKCNWVILEPVSMNGGYAVVKMSLVRTAPVTVEVLNASGTRVTLLANRTLAAGTHIVRWDTRFIAPGYYVVAVKTGQFTNLRNIVIVR